ncbi:POK8 protein, partial [Leucopsar rothschildi]|nr:POK8 protein [Leucopsar rothschildi]
PVRRFRWRVLPQGKKNSPSICQWYVASLLSPIHAQAGETIILHYMDDVLICAPKDDMLQHVLDLVINVLTSAGFELQKEKVQRTPPWKYLGLEITKQTIVLQKLAINNNPKTLADLHQLCGSLNWVRPWLGLTTEDLAPLFNLLKGGDELDSPRALTPEARVALEKVERAMGFRQAHRYLPNLPFEFITLGKLPHLHGLIHQWDQDQRDPLLVIEWVFLSHQWSKSTTRPQELMAQLIRKARAHTKEALEHLVQENKTLQFSLDSYTGQLSIHCRNHKLFNSNFNLIPKNKLSRTPLKALTIFTDASGAFHKSVITWKNPQTQEWEAEIKVVEGSPQIAELDAVVCALEKFSEPLNLVAKSAYMAGVVSRAEHSVLKEIQSPDLHRLLSRLIYTISHREQPYYIMHVTSHTDLPGFIAEGNQWADTLAAPAEMARLPDVFQQAKLSHQEFHQNTPGLIRQFPLSRYQTRDIVATCPRWQKLGVPTQSSGINPRGLENCELWQMDVMHIQQFGRLKYVHISVDTFSGAIFAFAHTGEKAKDVSKHLIQAFSVLGIPKKVKMDNGPAYTSMAFKGYLKRWGIKHKTGIPYSPTAQGMVECAHQKLKRVLEQQ